MNWQYFNPVQVVSTGAFTEVLLGITETKQDILIICSRRFQESEDFYKLHNTLNEFECFIEIENNPSLDSCQRAIKFATDVNPKVLIAIGGGSVIDTTKAMRMAICKSCSRIEELFECRTKPKIKPLLVAVPTTHGAGSELTMWATIWDKTNKAKYSLSGYFNYPDYAIYDPQLTSSLPLWASISSTLDALCHAWESLWNKNANPISSQFAIEAIRMIASNLTEIIDPIPQEVRKNLLMASMYAGLAFSNTETAAAHSISYPLTAHFDIHHGIACSMSLHSLYKMNSRHMQNELQHILSQARLSGFDELWERVHHLVDGKVGFTLHEYGVTRSDLEWLTSLAFAKGRMENNIVDLSRSEVLEILCDIY